MMKLAELTVAGFVDLMASDAPAPGGGSAAALEGALGAALSALVCALTIGKKNYAAVQTLAEGTGIPRRLTPSPPCLPCPRTPTRRRPPGRPPCRPP